MNGVPVTVIAAYEGVTTARVRQVIAKHEIEPIGREWNAKLYDAREVIAAMGHSRSKICERCSRRHREPQAWCSRCMCESLMREVPAGRSA